MLRKLIRMLCAVLTWKPISVTLRHESKGGDLRYLGAQYTDVGELLIEGQDLGESVERMFGSREYEYRWTIAREDLSMLAKALGGKKDVLLALRERFSGNDACQIGEFLKEHSIPHRFWNRIGN